MVSCTNKIWFARTEQNMWRRLFLLGFPAWFLSNLVVCSVRWWVTRILGCFLRSWILDQLCESFFKSQTNDHLKKIHFVSIEKKRRKRPDHLLSHVLRFVSEFYYFLIVKEPCELSRTLGIWARTHARRWKQPLLDGRACAICALLIAIWTETGR